MTMTMAQEVAMGTGYRVFFFDENDNLRGLSMARYTRLRRGHTGERLEEYAGKRVRCALVTLDVEARKPLAIEHVDYTIVPFDGKGRLDSAELERSAKLAVQSLPPYAHDEERHIIDARSRFARKRYEREFTWKPTPAIQAAIVAAIFEKERA
jgi:hypothetical protein